MSQYLTIAYAYERPGYILNLYLLYPAVIDDEVQKGRSTKISSAVQRS